VTGIMTRNYASEDIEDATRIRVSDGTVAVTRTVKSGETSGSARLVVLGLHPPYDTYDDLGRHGTVDTDFELGGHREFDTHVQFGNYDYVGTYTEGG
jgi:hypothetical protein